MAAWLRRGDEALRWDLLRDLGRPPSVAPPAWALFERISECVHDPASPFGPGHTGSPASTGAEADPLRTGPEAANPTSWLEETLASLPDGPSVCLVVPDATRVGRWIGLLPELLAGLESKYSVRTLLVATGTHRPASVDELQSHLRMGPRPGWDWRQNSEDQFANHVDLGVTSAGTPVRLHPSYVSASARVLLGETSYHYFAGFGGGPKLVFPGCAEPEGALTNHRRACGADWTWNEACGPGQVDGNPVLEDIEAAAALAPAHHSIVVASDPPTEPNELDAQVARSFPLRIFSGEPVATMKEVRAHHDGLHRIDFTKTPDVLIVDQGGRPRDATFLQSQKAIQHGVRFLRPGGRLLLLASCREGWGSSTLQRYAESTDDFRFQDDDLHRQTLTALRQAVANHQVGLWSELSGDLVSAVGMEPLADENAARAWVQGKDWGWLPRVERFLPRPGAGDPTVD